MRSTIVLGLFAALGLAACEKPRPAATPALQAARYIGVGTYSPGRLWMRIIHPDSKDLAAARLSDDDQVIVVVDTQTGEVRQCGNLSGFCVAMNPWDKPAAQSAPAPMQQHEIRLPEVSIESGDAEGNEAAAKTQSQ